MQLKHTLVLKLSALYFSFSAEHIYGKKSMNGVGYALSLCVDGRWQRSHTHSLVWSRYLAPMAGIGLKMYPFGHKSTSVNAAISHKHFSVAANSK